MYNLQNEEICKIYLSEGTYDDRFVLHFKTTNGIESLDENYTGNIYAANKTIYLNDINGQVCIYDIAGRLIKETSANGSMLHIPMQVTEGIYVVKTEQKSVKVVL